MALSDAREGGDFYLRTGDQYSGYHEVRPHGFNETVDCVWRNDEQ